MLHNDSNKINKASGTRVLILCLFLLLLSGGICLLETEPTALAQTVSGERTSRSMFIESSSYKNMNSSSEATDPGGQPIATEPPFVSAEPVPIASAEPTPVILETPSPTVSATKAPVRTPAPKIFSVKLKQTGTKVNLSWKKVSGAVSYQVYRGESGKKLKKYKRTKKKKAQVKYTYGRKYRVRIMAYNKKHQCVGISRVYSFYVPKQPARVHAVYQNQKTAKLTWKSVPRADYYLIYRKSGKGSARLIRQTKKCEYTNGNLASGYTYQYQIQAVYRVGKQRFVGKAASLSYDNHKIVATNHQKYSYAEMANDIALLSRKYPGIVHYSVIGKSEDGRNLYEVSVGNRHASKSVLIVSTLHAREYMASLLCMNQIEYYARNYREEIDSRKVSDVLNRVCIRYIPMANPDGVTISQQGISQIHREKLRKKLKKITKGVNTMRWKANARGVDLNDNFPYQFQVKGKAGSQGYSGIRAANSKEAAAIVRRIKALKGSNLKAVVNYHAMGSIIYGSSNGAGSASAANDTQRMYQTAREITGYTSAGDGGGSGSGGGLREYVMCDLGLPSITLEIGRHPCPGSISEFPRIWRENANLVLGEAALFY